MNQQRFDMPYGAACLPEGVRFALWAPSAKRVELLADGAAPLEMPPQPHGWFATTSDRLGAGARYQFRIDGDLIIPDPASRFQPEGIFAPSQVVDPKRYNWRSQGWRGRPWSEAVIWEAHVGTATPQGTYAALADQLPRLRDMGITAIELMPLADFPGTRNWGYDGVLPFAPNASYGTPDDLRGLIDRAHELGLMVLIDVVYNHFGPSGNFLHAYARNFFTERHQTPWGAGLNFDGPDAAPVRNFFVSNACYWLEEFRADGLRLDAVHAIRDDSANHVLLEIAQTIRKTITDRAVHLILENEDNEARWLTRTKDGAPLLYTAQWNDDIHHCWHVLLTNETEGYYRDFKDAPARQLQRSLAEGFVFQGDASLNRNGKPRGEPSADLPPDCFIDFLQNHDQIGNRALGERLTVLAPPERLATAMAVLLLAPHIPLLFMGEEWGTQAPFQFFVDFANDEALSKAVREGRQREFASFSAFAGGGIEVPDPTDERTFHRSKLDWSEADRPPFSQTKALVRECLALRARHLFPLLESGWLRTEDLSHDGLIDLRWSFRAGTWRLILNLGTEASSIVGAPAEQLIWSNATDMHPERGTQATWTAAFFTGQP
jgi:maltooligosyltrehalose trehalohydrolase